MDGERFIGLVRVSTVRQGESRLGLDAGLKDIEDYVARVGGTVVQTLEEIESGGHDDLIDRPVLLKALTLCKRHNATLLIPRVDRLVRSTLVHSDIKRMGVPFRACDNPTANEFTLDILVAVSAQEKRAIGDRTRKALAIYKEQKRVSKRIRELYDGNVPPDVVEATAGKLGATLVGCHLTDAGRAKGRARANVKKRREAIEVYADLRPEMQAWRAQGLSLRDIAARLNDAGHTTRQGVAWQSMHVWRVLQRTHGGKS